MKACSNCGSLFRASGNMRYCSACRGSAREKRAWYLGQKTGPCADCGRTYPTYVMQFDHRPGAVKLAAISQLVGSAQPLCVLQSEVSKCDLVCTNCHLIRTFDRGRFVRTSLATHGPTEKPNRIGVVGWGEAVRPRLQELSPQFLAQRVSARAK